MWLMPSFFPMARRLRPFCRKLTSFFLSTKALGRPSRLPLFSARLRPAFTRSAMMSLSNWATAEMIVKIADPKGLEVSMFSEKLTKAIPRWRNSSRASIRCFVDLAKRSKRQTRTVSNLRLRASSIKRFRAGRESFVPLIPSSQYSSQTSQPRESA